MNRELKLAARCADDSETVLKLLTGAIVGGGGWVLSRTLWDEGGAEISFEFERRECIEMYTYLIAAGLELSHASHLQLADLCQCTQNMNSESRFDLARVDLRIRPDEIGTGIAELGRGLG